MYSNKENHVDNSLKIIVDAVIDTPLRTHYDIFLAIAKVRSELGELYDIGATEYAIDKLKDDE